MTSGLRLQRALYFSLALASVVGSLTGLRLAPLHELLVAGALIVLLGMPHGALDVAFARKLFGVVGLLGWALFSLLYVGLAAVVVGFWFVAPTAFLWVFLVGSALHFGGDLAEGTSRFARTCYGGAVIVLPALWHGPELQRLLGLVAGPASAAHAAPVLSQLAAPWLCATALSCLVLAKRSRMAALELLALAALSVTAPPLLAFTVYFCAMHSPRHILRTLGSLAHSEVRNALMMALWPTLAVLAVLAVLAMLALAGALAGARSTPEWVTQIVFVGLAALTLPHMLLLERARRADQATQP